MKNKPHLGTMKTQHRWEQTVGEQKCYRCGLIRRLVSGVAFTESAIKRSEGYEYSKNWLTWTAEIPECDFKLIKK